MKIPEKLKGRKGVVIDTNIFIYALEDDPNFGEISEFVLAQADAGVFEAAITPITAAEIITKPLRMNRPDLADKCRSAIRSLNHIKQVDISYRAGELAGALRAKYALPLPDLLQAAVAMDHDRPALITNDKNLLKIQELDVILIDDFR